MNSHQECATGFASAFLNCPFLAIPHWHSQWHSPNGDTLTLLLVFFLAGHDSEVAVVARSRDQSVGDGLFDSAIGFVSV